MSHLFVFIGENVNIQTPFWYFFQDGEILCTNEVHKPNHYFFGKKPIGVQSLNFFFGKPHPGVYSWTVYFVDPP